MLVTLILSPPISSAIAPKSGRVATTLSLACAVAATSAMANNRNLDFMECTEFIVQIRICAQRECLREIQTATKGNGQRRSHFDSRSCIADEFLRTRLGNR